MKKLKQQSAKVSSFESRYRGYRGYRGSLCSKLAVVSVGLVSTEALADEPVSL